MGCRSWRSMRCFMRRYMHEYGVPHGDFAPFAINAHKNAMGNPYALFPHRRDGRGFLRGKMIADPVNLLDSFTVCDGAAAVVLCPTTLARSFNARRCVFALRRPRPIPSPCMNRRDLLGLEGAALSASKAYKQAKVTPNDIDSSNCTTPSPSCRCSRWRRAVAPTGWPAP